MQTHEFDIQVSRLKDVFGDRNYSDERVKVIWREVKDFDGQWFTRVVDRFIGECRQPPLMTEFREQIAKEREYRWQEEKKREKAEAKDFACTFPAEEMGIICQAIRHRIEGRANDQAWSGVLSAINSAANVGRGRPCSRCSDTGLVWITDDEGYEFTCRCQCSEGLKRPKTYQRTYMAKAGSA